MSVFTLTADVLGCTTSFHSWSSQSSNSRGRAHQNSPGLGAVNIMLAICHAAGTLTSAIRRMPLSCHRPISPSALIHASSVSADILPGTGYDVVFQTLFSLDTEPCLLGCRYAETSVPEGFFSSFCPKIVVRPLVAIGSERRWGVDPTRFLARLASRGSALW